MKQESEENQQLPEQFGVPYHILEKPGDYDQEIPHLKRTVGLVTQYEKARPKGRQTLLEQQSLVMARQPDLIVAMLNNLDLLDRSGLSYDITSLRGELENNLIQAVKKRSTLRGWTPDRMGQLIRLGLDQEGHNLDVIQNVKSALFNAPYSIEEAVDLHYSAAWAMVATPYPDVREELVSILCYEKEWFSALSPAVFFYTLGGGGLTDDIHIKRFYSVESARDAVANFLDMEKDGRIPLNSRRIQGTQSRIKQAGQKWGFVLGRDVASWFVKQERINKTRFESIGQAFSHDPYGEEYKQWIDDYQAGSRTNLTQAVDRLRGFYEKRKNLPYPYNIKYDFEEPLNKLVRRSLVPQISRAIWEGLAIGRDHCQTIAERPLPISDDSNLLIAAKDKTTLEEKNNLVRQVYQEVLNLYQDSLQITGEQHSRELFDYVKLSDFGYQGVLKDGKIRYAIVHRLPQQEVGLLASIIEYHMPYISSEQVKAISSQVAIIRKSIDNEANKSVGRRGYQILVSDPILRDLGYESMTFKSNADDTIFGGIVIDGQNYDFLLDSELRLIFGGDVLGFENPNDQKWLELLTLSHLKKLLCTEDANLEDELNRGGEQMRFYRKQVRGRREHLKKLPPGKCFSQDAFYLCLKSTLDKKLRNLDSVNKARGTLAREAGQWTYEKGVDAVDAPDAKPVKIAFKNASDDIRLVIPLGQYSQEELDRVDALLFGELEDI
jgi:hypothetical protein